MHVHQVILKQSYPMTYTMKAWLFFAASLLFGTLNAFPTKPATEPFLTQIDDETWVLGNDIWNLTQQRTYGVRLMFKGKDCVGEAVGHYVSYSMCIRSLLR